MPVIALARFVVVTQHALAGGDVESARYDGVTRGVECADNRRGGPPVVGHEHVLDELGHVRSSECYAGPTRVEIVDYH